MLKTLLYNLGAVPFIGGSVLHISKVYLLLISTYSTLKL